MSVAAIGVGVVGITAGLISNAQARKQQALANKITVPDANYEDSPYAKAMIAQANQMRNSRLPGAGAAERNIMTNQANTVGSIERNSQSGAQSLALLGAAQGNTNNAFQGLEQQEGQYAMQTSANLQSANLSMADNTFQSQLRKQMLAIQQKNALGLAATQNEGQGMNMIMNGAMAAGNIYAASKRPYPAAKVG